MIQVHNGRYDVRLEERGMHIAGWVEDKMFVEFDDVKSFPARRSGSVGARETYISIAS